MNNFVSKIKIIDKVSNYKLGPKNKDILRSFGYILSATKPDYKYNESYLIDYIDDFYNCQRQYKKKKDFVVKVKNAIMKVNTADFTEIKIVIDDIWEINNFDEGWSIDFYENGSMSRINQAKVYIAVYIECWGDKVEDYVLIENKYSERMKFIGKVKKLIKIAEE